MHEGILIYILFKNTYTYIKKILIHTKIERKNRL